MENTASKRQAKGKGKQKKQFLNNEAALRLAESIGTGREEESKHKAEKRQRVEPAGKAKPRKVSETKLKLKETKAMLAARRSMNKKSKRNSKTGTSVIEPAKDAQSGQPGKERKRVSFA
ncbi:hypothetical protein FA15DRAFT_669345 [Coprinopsis marcescibilis]|uniref:Uncharacterized protein n=1 Tax=Coprinopsis marcescibilis TaxID=230819 RepID=A0A5C3KXQ2_COPMA|nr:hypothetical protein FA15DRAFT_669345 [Coprinopsis marcescibilis]